MRPILVLAALSLSGLLFSCAVPAGAEAEVTPQNERVDADYLTSSHLVVEHLRGRLKGDLIVVDATVYNPGTSAFAFNYRFDWLDQDGMRLFAPAEVWIPRQIGSGETIEIRGVAPSPSASDFRLKMVRPIR